MANLFNTLLINNTPTDSNRFVKKQPRFGDHIRVCRYLVLYAHHGIYVSDNEVYHFSGEPFKMKDAKIVCTTLKEFLDGGTVEVREYNDEQLKKKNSPQRTVEIAKQFLGCKKGEYSAITDNCEDFANYCTFNEKGSKQVKLYSRGLLAVAAAGLALIATKGKIKV